MALFSRTTVKEYLSGGILQHLGLFKMLLYAAQGAGDSDMTVWFLVSFGWHLNVDARNSSLFKGVRGHLFWSQIRP